MKNFADGLHNMSLTVLLLWQQTAFQTFPDILGFSGHLWSFIFIYASGASSAWSSKHNKLQGLLALIYVFQAENHWIIEIRLKGFGKEWIAMGT